LVSARGHDHLAEPFGLALHRYMRLKTLTAEANLGRIYKRIELGIFACKKPF